MIRRGFKAYRLLDQPPTHKVFVTWNIQNMNEGVIWFCEAIRKYIKNIKEKRFNND